MILYHGTNNHKPILNGDMNKGTWLASNLSHAYRLAERRTKQRGGKAIIVEIDVSEANIDRVVGRNLPTYRFSGDSYKVLSTFRMIEERYEDKLLRECPFCGEDTDISLKCKRYKGDIIEVNGSNYWFVECLPCDANTGWCFDNDAAVFGYKDGKEMAIDKWNRRYNGNRV